MVGRLCPTRPDQPAVCVLGRGVEIRTSVVVERYFAAEHRLDPVAAAACFTDDAVLVEPNGRRHVGRLAIKVFYETLYAGIDQLDVWVVDEVTAGARAAIEWQATSPIRMERLAFEASTSLRSVTDTFRKRTSTSRPSVDEDAPSRTIRDRCYTASSRTTSYGANVSASSPLAVSRSDVALNAFGSAPASGRRRLVQPPRRYCSLDRIDDDFSLDGREVHHEKASTVV